MARMRAIGLLLLATADAALLPPSRNSSTSALASSVQSSLRNSTAATSSQPQRPSTTEQASYQPWDPAPFEGASGYYAMQQYGVPQTSAGPGSLWQSWLSFTEYGRQPACTADYSSFIATHPLTTETVPLALAPSTGTTAGWGLATGYGTTTTVENVAGDHCCGVCDFFYFSVQLLYWPVATPTNTWCLTSPSATANRSSISTIAKLRERSAEPLITPASGGVVYTVDGDGFTYTSPSIYIKFPTLGAQDSCGPLGPQTSISTTLAFAPGELTTLEGFCIAGCAATSQPFEPGNMPCGPQTHVGVGVGDSHTYTQTQTFSYGGTNTYQPVFAQIPGLNQIFPEWWNCTAATGYMGQDPPRTLDAGTAMVASVTKTEQANSQSTPAVPSPTAPPLPINTGITADPTVRPTFEADPPQGNTKSIQEAPSAKDPATVTVASPTNSPDSPLNSDAPLPGDTGSKADPAVNPTAQADPPQGNTIPSQGSSVTNKPVTPVVPDLVHSSNSQAKPDSNVAGPSTSQELASATPANAGQIFAIPSVALQTVSQSRAVPFEGAQTASNIANFAPDSSPQSAMSAGSGNADPVSVLANSKGSAPQSASVQGGSTLQASHWVIGGLTFSPVPSATQSVPIASNAGSKPATAPPPSLAEPPSTAATIADIGQAASMIIGGETLIPGGSAISISGTVVSLALSHVVIGESTMSLPSPTPDPVVVPSKSDPIFTVAGQEFTAKPSGFQIGSATVLPGASAVSVLGTPVSLASSQIVIGTSTISLLSDISNLGMTDVQHPPTFTLGGHTYLPNPTGFTIGSATILPGASPVLISGTPISLASSQLVIGTSTLLLPSGPPTSPTSASFITIGSETIALQTNAVILAGHTLTPGAPAVTINGNAVSLGSSALVVGDRTETFAPAQGSTISSAGTDFSSTANIGALIISGLGAVDGGTVAAPSQTPSGSPSSGSGNGTLAFTGQGMRTTGVEFQSLWTIAYLVMVIAICCA